MDLVEIRKKAKSRKSKEKERTTEKRRRKGPAAETDSSLEEGAESGAATEELLKPERPHEEKSRAQPKENEVDDLKEANRVSDRISSLQNVLLSQQEEDEEVEEEEQLQLLVFLLGQEEYALNIMDLKEIIRPKEVTEVPRAPDYIQGILSLRGTIIPVMDVNKRLGLPVSEPDPNSRIIVVKWREHLFGLFVDGVVQVMNLPLAEIEPPPEIIGGVEGEFLRGVGKVDDRLIILLNLSRILDLEEKASEQDRLALEDGS